MNTDINPQAQSFQRYRAELAEMVKWPNPNTRTRRSRSSEHAA